MNPEIPSLVSLAVIVTVLAASVLLSLRRPAQVASTPPTTPGEELAPPSRDHAARDD